MQLFLHVQSYRMLNLHRNRENRYILFLDLGLAFQLNIRSKHVTDATAANPPSSLDELRELVGVIQKQEASTRLGTRTFRTLAGMIDAPRQTAVMSITQLADNLNVNASTLTRLAKRLGYQGFSEFQDVFRRHFANEGEFYTNRVNQILKDSSGDNENLSLVARIAKDEATNTSRMLDQLDSEVVANTAEILAKANAVRLHGLRQFFSLACFMSYGLGLIRNNVHVLGDPGHGVAHALAQLRTGDALVVMGSDPYTRATVDACRIAASHGLRIIAITDSYASPLATAAEQSLIIRTDGRYFGNSMASAVILAEGVLALVASKLGQEAIKALRKREMLFDELGVALTPKPSTRKPN